MLDCMICDFDEISSDDRTYREYIRDCEEIMGWEHKPIDEYSDEKLQDYYDNFCYLCGSGY